MDGKSEIHVFQITMCPKCNPVTSTRQTVFRTTTREPAQIIRYFVIFKEYDTNNCTLQWSADFPVFNYKVNIYRLYCIVIP